MHFHNAGRKERTRNKSKRAIACELEIASVDEDAGISRNVRRWHGCIVEDGSLPDSGFEICTAPASGDLFLDQIDDICGALSDSGAEVSAACGFHVHIDARDFRYFELRKLILLYAKIEDALFDMVPKSRRSNHYCKPCGQEYLALLQNGKSCKESIVKMTYKTNCKDVKYKRGNKYEQARYAALNLHSWFYRGTIECRLAAGTASADKVKSWGMLWASILDYCYSHTEKAIAALCNSDKTSLEVLLTVAPDDDVRTFIKERTAKFA